MKRFEFHLSLSAADYLQYYQGSVNQVLATSTSGLRVQFPAGLLQKFVSDAGVSGHFVLTCDDEGKGAELTRLA